MSVKHYDETAYSELSEFVFGESKYPVALKNGMIIGGGTVYPEINFTLPPLLVTRKTIPEIAGIYKEIISGVCERAYSLSCPGFVAEFETLPQMTENPEWGIEICKNIVGTVKESAAKRGIRGAVRVTPSDIREGRELEHMWRGRHWEALMRVFDGCAKAGADFLSIESVGGREVHEDASVYCDIEKSIFALSVLGCSDMNKLWTFICSIASSNKVYAAGDSGDAFANTAMMLAEKNYIPKVFAAAVRVMTAVRGIIPYECGAEGPNRDCGYEGVYIKAITGCPVSMDGKNAAAARLSPVGNIPACVCDLWSNKSVQNIKALSGMAPVAAFETLVYDCRLMNAASARGRETAILLRDLFAESDSRYDPQACLLKPDTVLEIAEGIVKEEGYYRRTKKAAELAFRYIRESYDRGELNLNDKERLWLGNLSETVAAMPDDISGSIEEIIETCDKLDPEKYDLPMAAIGI